MSGGAGAFLGAAILFAVPATLGPALLRVRGTAARLVAAAVVGSSVLVALATLVSLVDRFTPGWMLAGQALAAGGFLAAWLATGGRPARPRRLDWRAWAAVARSDWLVTLFGATVAVAMIVQLWQGLQVVSNGWDPVAYHLSRAAHWVQNASVTQFPGGSARQLGYPPDAEILQAWTMLMSGGDRWVNVIQWSALGALAAAIVCAARLLRFSRPAALLAALLVMAMPIPIMQATTAQNDVVASLFTLAAVVFGVRGLRDRHHGELAVAAAALALALGTKGIVLVAGPSLLLVLAAVLVRFPQARSVLPQAALMLVAAVLALAAYNFVSNVRNTGDLYGGAREGVERTSGVVANSFRTAADFVDMPGVSVAGLDRALAWLSKPLRPIAGDDFTIVPDSRPDDSTSTFGLVGWLFLFPALLVFALHPRVGPDRRIAAIAALLFFLVFPLSAERNPDFARLALPGVALGAPLLAALHRRPALAGAAVTAAVVTLVPCVLANPLKPLTVADGAKPGHELDRHDQFGLAFPSADQALDELAKRVPPDEPIIFVGGFDGYEYPFFGARLERRVTRMLDPSGLTPERMRAAGVRAAVLDRVEPPDGLEATRLSPEHWLVTAGAD